MRRALVLVCALAVLPVSAQAEVAPPPVEPPPPSDPAMRPPPPGWRLMLSDLTLFRVNPLGLETRGRFGFQKRLYESASRIGMNNFMFAGVYPKLNPASANLAAGVEIQPASMFNLRMLAEVQQYFGTLGFLQSFGSATARYSDHRLKELRDVPGFAPQAAAAFHASIQPMLQMKFGPIAVRSLLQLDFWDMALRDGDVVGYEPTFDTLLPDRGWTLSTDTDVLYVTRRGLVAGLRHTFVRPLYTNRHFGSQAEADAYANDNAHQRLGLFAAYTLRDDGPSRFNKPTVVLIVSWYLTHRWRTGERDDRLAADTTSDDFVSRAFPYLLLGFAFESDFLDVR
ncbi:MAG: hypothetical protein H0T79_00475 [Deltaproteobacteria bacterium]|nr:hypothetical protein [Deltaproteobacteria bacterium]